MSDAEAFLGSYKEILASEVTSGIWPPELRQVYEPESCLKHSGAKEVYLVADKRTGGRVVLRASDLDAGERADVEYAILARLNFPGIPKTFGTLVRNGRSYLAREYFEGEPLDQVIARGVMQPPQIYHIARQICAILGYLHAQRPPVIHRDIKPQNIIMRPDGSIGLTDFGIARTYKEGSDSDTQYMGTLLYAPPEQYGYAQSSPQTDIYALGIVLIYLATGSPDRRDLTRRIANPQLRSLIEKCIAFDPKNRFANVEQVIKRIDSMKTRKLRIAGIVAASCLALALVGVGIWQLVPIVLNSMGLNTSQSSAPQSTTPTATPTTTPQQTIVDAASLLSEIANADYPSTGDPHLGSTNWLYDFTNDGNLQANINNGGFAVTGDNGDSIYVSSGDGIYELSSEGTVLSQIYSGSVNGSLNILDNKLYFPDLSGTVHVIDLATGEESEIPGRFSAERLYFDDGRLYLLDMDDLLNLYSVGTDGSALTSVGAGSGHYYANIVDGFYYYADSTDGNRIYARELATGNTALVFDSPALWLSVCNGRIYFEDDEPGRLASIKLDGTDYRVLYDQPCYFINATSHGVFAVNAITKELVALDSTGGEPQVLLEDGDVQFCVAGGWVFYRASNTDTVLGMVRENGSDNREFVTGV